MSDKFYPVGAVLPYAGAVSGAAEGLLAAQGFLPCDGRGLPKADAQYQALQTVLNGAYGSDDGMFYLPDYRGRFFRGVDAGASVDPERAARTAPRPDLPKQGNAGNAVGSLQVDAFKGHSHGYDVHKDYWTCNLGSRIGPGVYQPGKTMASTSKDFGGSETRPVNAYVHYVIRFR